MTDIYDLFEDLREYPEFNEYFSREFTCEYYLDVPISLLQEKFGLDRKALLCVKEDSRIWISISDETVSFGIFD